ncbi:DNA sulfur modification protein DndB [Streptomyces aidingensis]|uniref:DNA sulfur modification protein DndB n=1 Tax=Streptomyces aidingensis TaxID=910347 RepID=UPI001FE26B54|nr:DNA sulfur modification protein DndB [Streptomyces aidingensis]
MDYIMTKARLGEDSPDPERQLTKNLAPVRELMRAEDMDFNQLLQRDLDDHRVAEDMIPYLLRRQAAGCLAFFPPIVAVLLPFRNYQPSKFPALDQRTNAGDAGAEWQQERAGTAFQVQRVLDENGRVSSANFGKLWWNKSEAQLVVLDGQHRAMALLAVERTMTNSWQQSAGGARFRSFYENKVNQLTQELRKAGTDPSTFLSGVEVPVAVCWFPEQTGEQGEPHEAARKLFVDVNKEARPPSESRIILLSDTELANVLARRMLSELRTDRCDSYLPLCAVEYDNPEENTTRSARWSVLTNIHLLKSAVDRCIFGPDRFLKNVKLKFGGRPSETGRDEFMRTQLDLASLFPDRIEDGGFIYRPEEIGNRRFPLGQKESISDRFAQTWGKAFLTLLSKIAPYAAHSRALIRLKDGWHKDDSTGLVLAHDALFSGVGVYWTLRDSYAHFQDHKQGASRAEKTDVILSWEALEARRETFESYRVREYLDSGRPIHHKQTKAAYAVFNTHACQLGLIMTLGSLWELRKGMPRGAALKDLPAFAESLVAGWNAFFSQESGKARDRRLAFNKDEISNPLNQISNMDTSQAVYFRYFWLEALLTPAAREHITPWFTDMTPLVNMVSEARELYLRLCTNQQLKALKLSRPGSKDSTLLRQAEKNASLQIMRALRDWFYMPEEAYERWFAERGTAAGSSAGSPAGEPDPSTADGLEEPVDDSLLPSQDDEDW